MIYTEMTPNPASLKFIVNRILLKKGSADFPDLASADDAPIAKKLFNFSFVDRVFVGHNFITITKTGDFQWEDVIPAVKDFLKGFFASDVEPLGPAYHVEEETADADEDETVSKIKELIDSHVRPAVAMDGGDIIYQGFEDGTVMLKLQGSCSGCPSSTITLKAGIEGLLTRMVPEVKRVEAI